MEKSVIAARANYAAHIQHMQIQFYKSYIRDIHQIDTRPIPQHAAGLSEKDYTFTYMGVTYRVNEHIVPNDRGDARFSAQFVYSLIRI